MPRVRALRDFISGIHGNITTGDKFTADDARAKHYIDHGLVELVKPDPVFAEIKAETPADETPTDPQADTSEQPDDAVAQASPGNPAQSLRERAGRGRGGRARK